MRILVISNSIWNIYNFRYALLNEISKKYNLLTYCDKQKKISLKKQNLKNLSFTIFQ